MAVDRFADRLRRELIALPELAGWQVNVYRGTEGRLACRLHHPLRTLIFEPQSLDNLSASAEIREWIARNYEIPLLNRAPRTDDPSLVASLRDAVAAHDWSFDEYCEVLETMYIAGRLSIEDMDWLILASRDDATAWPPAGRTQDRNATDKWGSSKLPPWESTRSLRSVAAPPTLPEAGHQSREIDVMLSKLANLQSMRKGFVLGVMANAEGTLVCSLWHQLLGRVVAFDSGRPDVDSAFESIRSQILRNGEVAAIASGPPTREGEVLGVIRMAATERTWSPDFLFEVLQVLRRARRIGTAELIWMMELGPAGDVHWRNASASARAEYQTWRLDVLPEWRRYERENRRSEAAKHRAPI